MARAARLLWSTAGFLLLGCADRAPPDATALPYGDSNVAATLDLLVAAEARRAERDAAQDLPVTAARVQTLEDRIARVELELARLEEQGIIPAAKVGYDPRSTTLDARDLQAAVDELHARVKAIEEQREPGMGSPSNAMFTQPSRQGRPDGARGPAPGEKGGPTGGPPPGNGKR